MRNKPEFHKVYLFYDPRDEKGDIWPCKIGMTKKSIEERVGEQTNQWTVSPVFLQIDIDLHEDQCKWLERRIHDILEMCGRQLPKGREWFNTSPTEVKDICDFILKMTKKPLWETERLLYSETEKISKKEKYRLYFNSLVKILRKEHAFTKVLTNTRQWDSPNFYFKSGLPGIYYGAWFRGSGITWVYVSISQKGKYDDNRLTLFDTLKRWETEIAAPFNHKLEWHRNPEKKESYIFVSRPGDIEASEYRLGDIRDWHVEYLLKFKTEFQPIIEDILKS